MSQDQEDSRRGQPGVAPGVLQQGWEVERECGGISLLRLRPPLGEETSPMGGSQGARRNEITHQMS